MNRLDRLFTQESSLIPATDPRQLLHEHADLRHAYLDFCKRFTHDDQLEILAHGTTPNGTVVLCTARETTPNHHTAEPYTVATFDLPTGHEQLYQVTARHALPAATGADIILELQPNDAPDTPDALILLSSQGSEWKQGSCHSEQLADMRLTTLHLDK